MTRALLTGVAALLLMAQPGAQAPQLTAEEDAARRRFQNGQRFMERGNHTEALRDFSEIAAQFPTSSVADDALLAIAQFHVDTSADADAALKAATTLLEKYKSSETVPAAYVLRGRVALMGARTPDDVLRALADFDRVEQFQASDAQPAALHFAIDALGFDKRHTDALERYARLLQRYPQSTWAVRSGLLAARSLAQMGQKERAIEALQRVRLAAPGSPAGDVALAWTTVLYRLFVRPVASQPSFWFSGRALAGTAGKLRDVIDVEVLPSGEVVAAQKSGALLLAPTGKTERTIPGQDVRDVMVDGGGRITLVLRSGLARQGAPLLPLTAPKTDKSPRPLEDIRAAVQLSTSDLLVSDPDAKAVLRFTAAGKYVGPFHQQEARRLAVNWVDDVAVLERESGAVSIVDRTGKPLAKIVKRGTGYELNEVVDVQFDPLGHLYVLDRDGARSAVYVFTPEGTLIVRHALPDKTPGHFREPAALAIDHAGRLFVYDERAQAIQVHQ